VRVDKGLKSFGGFILGQPHAVALTVPEYPRLLSFVGEGALLSLRGERRVTVVTRNMPAMRLEVGRVVPEQLHHLVQFNEGSYGQPGAVDHRRGQPGRAHGKAHHAAQRVTRPRPTTRALISASSSPAASTACSCCRCAR
jgi:hypothetical protein